MFSKGQTVFAILFAISFITIIIFMYLKDKKIHKQQYQRSFCNQPNKSNRRQQY